jgi:hypothetical protein
MEWCISKTKKPFHADTWQMSTDVTNTTVRGQQCDGQERNIREKKLESSPFVVEFEHGVTAQG